MENVKYSETWMKFLKKHKLLFDKNNIKIKSGFNKSAVFIESRIDEKIELVIKNFMYYLHTDWNLIIFYTENNEEYIRNITQNIGEVKLIKISENQIDANFYNHIFKSNHFYDLIDGEYFLIFQMDTLLRKPIPDKFFKYSYVGAPWRKDLHHVKMAGEVGNGGFSLRNKRDMMKIIQDVAIDWSLNEDVYFSNGCDLLKLTKPTSEEAKEFSVESIFYEDPVGMHAPWFEEQMFVDMLKL